MSDCECNSEIDHGPKLGVAWRYVALLRSGFSFLLLGTVRHERPSGDHQARRPSRRGNEEPARRILSVAPPVGDLRFRDPQPPQPWTGVRDATRDGSMCAQFDPYTTKIIGDDDCLYLNIATTSLTGSRPVMVWIHGGGFIFGDGSFKTYTPDYLVASGIVYVSINYRLGVLGFLNLDNEVAPGNAGLKDQVAALKWVKENIVHFGGDPNNVTIFGESAGGASIHYLLLSPLAKGVFHKAISQSGVVLNYPWAQNSETMSVARRLVAALRRNINDPREIVEYLRTIPSHRLIEIQGAVVTPGAKISPALPFGPTVDDKSVEPFMPRPPEEYIAEGSDVPVIIGHNSHEGIVFLIKDFVPLECPDESEENFIENFKMTVPRDLVTKYPSKLPEILSAIRKFYFGDKPITSDRLDEFSYDSPNVDSAKFPNVSVKGKSHAGELQYLFLTAPFTEHINIQPGSTEAIVQDRLVRMWTDFAKTGNPTPFTDDLITEKWEPVTRTIKNYLEINAELVSGVNPDKDVWDMWQRIYAMVDGQ